MVGLASCGVEDATASGLDLILVAACDIKDVIKAFKDGNLHDPCIGGALKDIITNINWIIHHFSARWVAFW